MGTAADEAATHVMANLRSRFGSKGWTEFSTRLAAHGERLFRLLHHLYGWRYDFAWIHEQIIQVAADGFLDRPKALRRIDRRCTDPPGWLTHPNSLLATTYLDRYASDVKGLRHRFEHLTSLGVTHLHLLPPFASPDGATDGGFAVSDYRRLNGGLGTTKELKGVAAELRDIGVTLVLDMVLSGTASNHAWAEAVSKGDSAYQDFYFLFPDRDVPDSYAPYLRPLGADRGGDAFTWHPLVNGGAWVWTTLSPGQWDLNYSNPNVLAAVVTEMLFLANLGAGVVRINGESFLWKETGTDCENLPQAHVIVQVLDTIARIAAPSVSLISGAMVPGPQSFVGPNECRAGYRSLLMSSVWESLATADTRLLARALADRSSVPPGCAWITYLRSHDDIGWWFDDDDAVALGIDPESHRRYLTAFYSGDWAHSAARGQVARDGFTGSGGGVTGTAASLAGLEAAVEGLEAPAAEIAVRRLLAAFAVILGADGVPMVFLGDETAQLSDHTHLGDAALAGDIRWSQRPAFDPVRLQSALAGEGPEGAMLAGFRHLLEVRRGIADVGPEIPPELFDLGDNGLVGFRRGSVTVVVNMTERPVIVARSNLPDAELFDLVANDTWDGHILGPYEYRYLVTPG
ncbi:MAG TPA: alpha-amylase family glycosyl hydrolase [Acidimicrobiia bacterium]|nr:alpha-amylase family glycosyl hydrolase [Acidimicrobiia bacterium]